MKLSMKYAFDEELLPIDASPLAVHRFADRKNNAGLEQMEDWFQTFLISLILVNN